jgi:hypothetical protein
MSLEMESESAARCSRTRQVAVCFADAILMLHKRGLLAANSANFSEVADEPVDLVRKPGICVDPSSLSGLSPTNGAQQ